MTGFHLLGVVFGAIPILLSGAVSVRDVIDLLTLRNLWDSFRDGRNKRLKDEYGLPKALLLLLMFPDALACMDRIEHDVLSGDRDGAIAMKQSIAANCNMIAVAGAIIAQVAITGLSLANVAATHWTTHAAFIMSLVAGALCVYYSCMVQQKLGGLARPEDIKDWLCRPGKWTGLDKELDEQLASLRNDVEAHPDLDRLQRDLVAHLSDDRWKMASINAAIMLSVPGFLLNVSVATFLVGLGIYLGFVFTNNFLPDAGTNAALAVLLVYIIASSLGLLLFFIPYGLKVVESVPTKRVGRAAKAIALTLDFYRLLTKAEDALALAKTGDMAARDRLRRLMAHLDGQTQKVATYERTLLPRRRTLSGLTDSLALGKALNNTISEEIAPRYQHLRKQVELLSPPLGEMASNSKDLDNDGELEADEGSDSALVSKTGEPHSPAPTATTSLDTPQPAREIFVKALEATIKAQEESAQASRVLLQAFQSLPT
ncbi:hypothetical protein MBLNU459_g8032t1 [Dothideomycetes sp. NU459]